MDIRSEIEANDSDDDISGTPVQDEILREQAEAEVQETNAPMYRFQMRHLFYIHLVAFIVIGLFGGLIIYLIENYSTSKNRQIAVSYVNAWFVTCTCVYSCGLTTLDFAKLSKTSQILLLNLTLISGITISTLPALIIKAYTHRHIEGITVDNDHGKEVQSSEDSRQNATSRTTDRGSPSALEKKFALLPTPQQLCYWSYITIIVLILATCVCLYLCYFIVLGAWLRVRYSADQLMEGNSTISPWYASIIIVVTGFNQNGLTPFSDGMARFVDDAYMNIFVMLVILSGTSLFPFLLRNVVLLGHRLAPWRYKIVFDYILLNHHHLSTLLFPTLQTRIYLFVTFLLYLMAVSISLILDQNNPYLLRFAPGTRLLILTFHAVSARFAGFQTIDISHFTTATLLIYLLLMATKPQMLCTLKRSRFELSWISLRADGNVEEEGQQEDFSNPNFINNVPTLRRRKSLTTSTENSVTRRFNLYLNRQRVSSKERAHKSKRDENNEQKHRRAFRLHFRLFLLKFVHVIQKETMQILERTRTWLLIAIFLICAIEHERITIDQNVTVFKIVFELVSAFGCVGLSLGYPGISSSFVTILSPVSRVIVGLTMLLGRHRGLFSSLKDQEEIEHNASELLYKWKEEAIRQWEESTTDEVVIVRL